MKYLPVFSILVLAACLDPLDHVVEPADGGDHDMAAADTDAQDDVGQNVCVRSDLQDEALAVFDFRLGHSRNLATGPRAIGGLTFDTGAATFEDGGLRVSVGRVATSGVDESVQQFWTIARTESFAAEVVYAHDDDQPAGRSYGTVLSGSRDVCRGGQNFLLAHENALSAIGRMRVVADDHTQLWLPLDGLSQQHIVFGAYDDRMVFRSSQGTVEQGIGNGRQSWENWPLVLGGEATSDCTETPSPFAGRIAYVAFYAVSPLDPRLDSAPPCLN